MRDANGNQKHVLVSAVGKQERKQERRCQRGGRAKDGKKKNRELVERQRRTDRDGRRGWEKS